MMENNLGNRFGKRSSPLRFEKRSAETPQQSSLGKEEVSNSLDAWLAKINIPKRIVSLKDFQETLSTEYFNSKQKRFRLSKHLLWALKPNFPVYKNGKRLIQLKNRSPGENKEGSPDSLEAAIEAKLLNRIETRGSEFKMPSRSFIREIMERFRILNKARATRRVDSTQPIPQNLKKWGNPLWWQSLASLKNKHRNDPTNNIRVVQLKRSYPFYLVH
jgi:hypothetical protein